ncbi:MAG: formate dehydrogenase [Thermodesulfobacteriota bacterium]|nr:formate dehydrogenase [Thermodesulfobacteriota bacterium]
MADKSFFVDTSICSACRGCQVACKQWNKNKAEVTTQRNWGNYQNPPDFTPNTFKLVRFNELEEGNTVKWYFFPDQCRHCIDAPCIEMARGLGSKSISQDAATGAVLFNSKIKVSKADFEEIRSACPYDVPRRNEKTGTMAKCTMCFDRITNGLQPACVKTCPSGAMNFGDRDKMLALANKRLEELKTKYPKAQLLNADTVRTIFLVVDDPQKYHKLAAANGTFDITRLAAIKKMIRPLSNLANWLG